MAAAERTAAAEGTAAAEWTAATEALKHSLSSCLFTDFDFDFDILSATGEHGWTCMTAAAEAAFTMALHSPSSFTFTLALCSPFSDFDFDFVPVLFPFPFDLLSDLLDFLSAWLTPA